MDIRQILDKVAEMHPYKVVGDADSYSDYAQGWTDAVNEIDSMLPTSMSGTKTQLSEESTTNNKTTEQVTGKLNFDIISRQAAIEINQSYHEHMPNEVNYRIWKEINELPSVTPEQKWIPVRERLPEEHDSIFARYYGTERWNKAMFRKRSDKVIVTTKFPDGTIKAEVGHTRDGEWEFESHIIPREAIAWMPLPEPYQESEGE